MKRWGAWALSFVVLLALAGSARAANTYIYWLHSGGKTAITEHLVIARAQLNGTHVDTHLVTRGLNHPCGLAVAGRYVYWVNNGTPDANQNGRGSIGRATLNGKQVNGRLIKGASAPCGIAVSGDYIYWLNVTQEPASSFGYVYVTTIGRAGLDGSHVQQDFIGLPSSTVCTVCGLAIRGRYIYWSNQGSLIGRANLNGGGQPDQNFIRLRGDPEIEGLAVTGSHIYWASSADAAIGRADLDGTHVQPRFLSNLDDRPYGYDGGVSVFGPYLYWNHDKLTHGDTQPAGGVGRVGLSGSRKRNTFINDPLISPPDGMVVGPG